MMPSAPFNSAKWKTASPEVRGSMVCDLLSIGVGEWRSRANLVESAARLQGLTANEVEVLLGPPDNVFCGPIYVSENDRSEEEYAYNVGNLNEKGPFQNPFHLFIGFDTSSVVSVVHLSD